MRKTWFVGFLISAGMACISLGFYANPNTEIGHASFRGILYAGIALVCLFKTIFPGKPKDDGKKDDETE